MSNPTGLPFSTGGAGQNADASPLEVITAMQNVPGWFSQQIYQGICQEDPFFAFASKSKRFFNEAMGDTDTTLIFDVGMPSERDVFGWQEVREASPGYNPSTFQVSRELTYGNRKVSATLFKDAVRTPPFSKVDLAFKPRREQQISQILQIMSNWTRGIWPHWARNAWQKASRCRVLNSNYGRGSEQDNAYPTYCNPNQEFGFDHLEEMMVMIKSAPRGFAAAGQIPGIEQKESKFDQKQVVFIGHEALKALMEKYYTRASATYGYRPDEVFVPELGYATPIGKYFFVTLSTPRRYRDRTGNETWDDAVIASTLRVPAPGGAKAGEITVPNPDYFNPQIAKYEEILIPNSDTAEWLVPPAAMTKSVSNGGKEWFPASDYSGEFMPINYQSDSNPMGETCYFIGRYMAGMKSLFPERSRAVLALAVHAKVDGVTVIGAPNNGVQFPVNSVALTATGNLQFLISGTLPAAGPAGTTLYAVSQNGQRYLVGAIVTDTPFAGNTKYPAGRLVELQFPSSYAAAQVDRNNTGDPWEYLAFLPINTPSDPVTALPTNLPASTTPTIGALIYTDTIVQAFNAANTSLALASGPFTTAASLQTALNTYLTANGGGSSIVTMSTALNSPTPYLWTIKITGAAAAGLTALRTGYLTYQDGVAATNKVYFVGTNLS
jgi:hypothetical protein